MTEKNETEDIDYKFDRDNDGMFREIMDKQELYKKYYLGIKGIRKDKHLHITHYKEVDLSKDFVLKYYYKFQDNPQYESHFVIKDKTKTKGEEGRYTIVDDKQALDYIELFHQGTYKEWVNYKGVNPTNGEKGYVRILLQEGRL